MTGIAGIIDQLDRSLEGDAWHGSSIGEALDGIGAADAAAHPVPGAHSIWELVHHSTVLVRVVHARVLGRVSEPEGEADWPPVRDSSEPAWATALDDLRRSQADLVVALRSLRDEDLKGPVPNAVYDRAHLLHGLIQHHTYHAGQMALLKRALRHESER